MENLITPSLFDPMREKSHFRISGSDNVRTVVLPACTASIRMKATKCSLNFFHGRVASRNYWSTGKSILFYTSMLDSCHLTFGRKGFIAKIGFAPWRVAAPLATGCRLTRSSR
jgi:hypothetical protein